MFVLISEREKENLWNIEIITVEGEKRAWSFELMKKRNPLALMTMEALGSVIKSHSFGDVLSAAKTDHQIAFWCQLSQKSNKKLLER